MKYSAGHRWYAIERRPRPWWLLERSRRTGESELVQGPGLVEGAAYECVQCGTVRVFARFADDEGQPYDVALYGFDLDALSPMRAPPCEVFARPLPADASSQEARAA